MKQYTRNPLYAITAIILAACAAGGGETGTGFNELVHGTISRFGSIYVNGVRYDTSKSTFSVDDVSGSERDLGQGMVVTFTANTNADGVSGEAGHITFENSMEGLVTSNVAGVITVMNQTITYSPDMVFDNNGSATILSVNDLVPGNGAGATVVEVSGYPISETTVLATRIKVEKEAHTLGEKVEIKGVVSSLNEMDMIFQLGNLTVAYDTNVQGFEMLANGAYIEVENEDIAEVFNVSNQLVATRIKLRKDPQQILQDSGQRIEFEGIVTSILPGAKTSPETDYDFKLNGRAIKNEDSSATFPITLNMELEVEGYYNSVGVFIAQEIEKHEDSYIRIEGYIDAGGALPSQSAIQIMGQRFYINNLTLMEDDSVADDKYLSVSDLQPNHRVEVRAYKDTDSGNYIATYVKRENNEGQVIRIEGNITAVTSATQLEVEGMNIDINSAPVPGFPLTVGKFVKLRAPAGGYTGGILYADEISE